MYVITIMCEDQRKSWFQERENAINYYIETMASEAQDGDAEEAILEMGRYLRGSDDWMVQELHVNGVRYVIEREG